MENLNTHFTTLGHGATFSSDAWKLLASEYKIPHYKNAKCVPAFINGEILKMTTKHGGYGVIAIESRCSGVIVESLDSFIPLLQEFGSNYYCPIKIIGALAVTLNICLMTRYGVRKENIKGFIAHSAAIRATVNKRDSTVPIIDAPNNGEAARLVATKSEYAEYAALGPHSAAEMFDLDILEENFEDEEAVTTFALIGSKELETVIGEQNQALVIFEIPNTPGSFEKVCELFSREELNMTCARTVHIRNDVYHFLISYKFARSKIDQFNRAVSLLHMRTKKHIILGPFPVIPR